MSELCADSVDAASAWLDRNVSRVMLYGKRRQNVEALARLLEEYGERRGEAERFECGEVVRAEMLSIDAPVEDIESVYEACMGARALEVKS